MMDFRRITGRILAAVAALMAFGLAGAVRAEAKEIDVTQYSYKVTPIYGDSVAYLYVKTDNPDPWSFRLWDSDSVYSESDSEEKTYYAVKESLFADVRYEKPKTFRVKGGYIFSNKCGAPDGGKLTLLQRRTVTTQYATHDTYERTGVTVTAPKLRDNKDRLIQDYTDSGMTFFEKLSAIQLALDELSVYPKAIKDSDKPNTAGRRWPGLAASPYRELDLNGHLEWMYESYAGGMLLEEAYPYVMNSALFPTYMRTIAKALEPDCTIENVSWNHALIAVTYGGETRYYGGSGNGNSECIYTDRIDHQYRFDNSPDDWFKIGNGKASLEKLLEYDRVANEDADKYWDLIGGETFDKTIRANGGSWIRVTKEGFFQAGVAFAYVLPYSVGVATVEDAWVDGRYVNEYETFEYGAKFEDHPDAGVVINDLSFTDSDGEEHREDVLFIHKSDGDSWMAVLYGYPINWPDGVPANLTLTRKQVKAMVLDANSDTFPTHSLIYDGMAKPGTPCESVTIVYDPDNGRDEPYAMPAEKGVPFELPAFDFFTQPDYTQGLGFGGWLIDGVRYEAQATYTANKSTRISALWKTLDARAYSGFGILVEAILPPGQTGQICCAYYDAHGKMVSLVTETAPAGYSSCRFDASDAWQNLGARSAKVFLTDEHFIPKAPCQAMALVE